MKGSKFAGTRMDSIKNRFLKAAMSVTAAIFVTLLLVASATGTGAMVFNSGSSQYAVWTTKGDFENNASTVVYPTGRSMVEVSGTNQGDDASVSLSSYRSTPIAAGGFHTMGIKNDGTVVAVGFASATNVSSWSDIVAVAGGGFYSIGLKSDGTMVTSGSSPDVSSWSGIVGIAAGNKHAVGIKGDGTVAAVSYPFNQYNTNYGQTNVSAWRDVVAVAAGFNHTVGLKSDGTVMAVGNDGSGAVNVSGWRDIVAVAAGAAHTIGLKSDGTVVAVGENSYGQTNVSSWSGIPVKALYRSHGLLSYLRLNAGDGAAYWDQISWNGAVPGGTAIKFRTRGADTEAGLESASWSGYHTSSGSQITTPASSWLEVEANLETGDPSVTPVLDDLRVSYSFTPPCVGEQPTLSLGMTGVRWASYADFTAGLLSVDYSVGNGGSNGAFVRWSARLIPTVLPLPAPCR